MSPEITDFCTRIADIHSRSDAIKKDAVSLGVDVIAYMGRLEQLPPSDDRDNVLRALGSLKIALITLGALENADISELPSETRET